MACDTRPEIEEVDSRGWLACSDIFRCTVSAWSLLLLFAANMMFFIDFVGKCLCFDPKHCDRP